MIHYILFLNTHSLFQKIIINTIPTVVENISILRTEVLVNIYNLFCDSAVKQTPSWINLSERTWIITIIRDSYGSQGLRLTIDSEMNWTCEQKPLGTQETVSFTLPGSLWKHAAFTVFSYTLRFRAKQAENINRGWDLECPRLKSKLLERHIC